MGGFSEAYVIGGSKDNNWYKLSNFNLPTGSFELKTQIRRICLKQKTLYLETDVCLDVVFYHTDERSTEDYEVR